MSKKMWNKIFKSKTNKNSKTLQAANKINKRSSIYEEYQQLNAALDIIPINEKFKENTPTEAELLNDKKSSATKIPQSTTTTTFSKVVNTLTLKRSQNSNSSKDLKNVTGNGNEGKEKNCKKNNSNNITTPTEVPETNASVELVPCPICSRTFNPVTLRKHVGICEKMATKKRNIFDSSRQRREGTDLATYPLPKNYGLPEKATSSTSITQARSERGHSPKPAVQQVSSPILTRKKPTEDLIRSTARASMRKAVSNNNSPASTSSTANSNTTTPSNNFSRDRMRSSERSLTRRGIQPPPAEQCPHCERCFGIKAYDRHVEWCKEKALQAAIKQGSSKNEGNVAKARLEARTKYRAPCLKTKRSINREKYSGAAGEEHENDDTSKSSKTNGNKTQDLMSMSMTSSICSERNITNCTTGNINEPVAVNKVQTNSSHTIIVGSRKCTRDKSQTPQPPTTTIATANAIAASSSAAMVITSTKKEQKQQHQQDVEPIINLEIEMPEFHLMGEQMTATAINKKRNTIKKATKTTKLNAALTAAKIKPLKHKEQQQQQLLEQENLIQINPNKSNQKLKTTDVQIILPPMTTPTTLEQKKSASNLSLKLKCRDKRLQVASHKAFESDNDHKYRNYYCDNDDYNHNEVKFEAKEELPAENLDLTTSLTFYGSSIKSKENDKILQTLDLQVNGKQMESDNKITMEEYFNKEDNFVCFKSEQKYLTENKLLDSREYGLSQDNSFETINKSDALNTALEEVLQFSDIEREEYIRDLVMKQTLPDYDNRHTDDYDQEEDPENDITNNSILLSIPKLDIPKSPNKISTKEKNLCKVLGKFTNKTENISQLNNPSNKLKNAKEYSSAQDLYTEIDIYKDCFTDSDELRRQNKTTENYTNTPEHVEKEPETRLSKEIIKDKNFKSSSESATVIRYPSENSYELIEFKEFLNIQNYNKLSNSSEDLSFSKSNVKNSNALTYNSKPTTDRNDTPRIPNSLRLPQLSSSPPPPTAAYQISRTTPCTPKNENIRIKSLVNISQPKRKKNLRQTASCTNTLPMKAIIPLSRESLEICGVSSAPQIKIATKSKSILPKDVALQQLESQEENYNEIVNEMEEEEEKKHTYVLDKEIKVIKEPPQLKRNRSFTISGLPDNYDPFLSAKRQLEELCSPTSDSADIPTTPQTPQLPSMPATPSSNNKMSTSLILSSSTPNTTPNLMTTSQIPQQTQKTPTLTRSSSFRRTSSLRGPRRSPMLSTRPPLFAQKHRPTIQRGLSDEGPISTNFLKPEEYDEMPVRSVCVNDFAVNKSPRVVRRDTSTSNRKQPLKLNINAANGNSSSATVSPNVIEPEMGGNNTASKYVLKTDSLAVFLKYEHELEKLNNTTADNELKKENVSDVKTPSTASTISTPLSNLDGPLNAKELKDKSNNLSKQNSAKNIKADILAANDSLENYDNNNCNATTPSLTNDVESVKYAQVRLTPLATKPSTPLTKPTTPQQQQQQQQQPSTPQLTPLNVKNSINQNQEQIAPKSPKPVALSSIFGSDNKTTKQSTLLYSERKNSIGSDYIDPKLINKCDNLPINLNLKRTDFKHSDSDASETRMEHFSSSSSESSAPAKKTTSLTQNNKFLPSVKQQQPQHQQQQPQQQQQQQQEQNNNLNINQNHLPQQPIPSAMNSQRNSAEGRNLLKRRMRLGRNQFLYDASPEGDSCSADDEGANRSSMEGDVTLHHHRNLLKEHEKAFERLTSLQVNPIDPPFIPPMPAFDDFDFEEFLSSFENDEEQFPLFKDCREFLMNRTSKKQRSMLMPNSTTQNTTNMHSNSTNFKNPSSPQTFPPITPQTHSTNSQHFQFPALPQHPKNLFNSFSLNNRSRNKYDELAATKSTDTFSLNSKTEEFKDVDNQKREIFISIETEQNDLDKSPISPNSIRNMVGNPQTVVEVEVDAAHDNKFSKISDDDTDTTQNICRSKNFSGHLMAEHLPNVQLNNAKNLIQQMQEDFRQMGEEMSGNLRLQMEHRTAPVDMNMNTNSTMTPIARKMNRAVGTPSGDAYGDSDELSSLDGYPLSSPNSRLGVSSKTSADSAYGSLSRQRSSELTSQRNASRSRPMTSNTANTLVNRPLAEETSLGRSRQLSASSSSSSEHALPPITKSNSYHKQQQQQQQQHFYNNNNNNNNNIANDLDDLMRYERTSNNNNYDIQPTHPNLTGTTNSHSNLESLQQYNSNSTMSTSMKMSKFCHECGTKFLLETAKFCMDCGVKRIVL